MPPSFIVDASEAPRFIQITPNLCVASFQFMKNLTANYMVEAGIKKGQVTPGKTMIIETTSGTFGFALALTCLKWNLPLTLVVQPDLEDGLKKRLKLLGAKLEVALPANPQEDLQISRMRRLKELQSQFPDHYWPSQYGNEDAQHAYTRLGTYIMDQVGEIDTLVGAVGTGGSMCGTSKALRLVLPRLKCVGVDATYSIGFGQEAGPSLLGGLGTAIPMPNLDHTQFNEVHWIPDAVGFRGCRELATTHGIFAGGSSGCAYVVAKWEGERNPHRKTLVILPDEDRRYEHTIYNDDWLKANQVWLDTLPAQPEIVSHPSRSHYDRWSMYKWDRRTYFDVTGKAWVLNDQEQTG